MTYEEMKRRVERLEVLRTEREELWGMQQGTLDHIDLRYGDGYTYLRSGWIPENDGFNRMAEAIKRVAAEISDEINTEIAKLEADE